MRIDVTQPWMVTGTDVATVTRTNQFNGWGNTQTFYVIPGAQELVVPGTQSLVAAPKGADQSFRINYAELGPHQVVVDTSVSPPTLSIQSEANACAAVSCPNGSRCKLAPEGRPVCE
jgi:hypothetical protein